MSDERQASEQFSERLAWERYVYEAVMNAIELTVTVCDVHEDEDIPREARCVDYAGILAIALMKAAASSPLAPTQEGAT